MYTRRSWREKMDNPNLPKVVDIPPNWQSRSGPGTMLVPSPHQVEALIRAVRKGRLITPPGTDNILEGITRDSIFELARRELGIEVVERSIDRSELYLCDELFLSGTAVGIAPVVRVDHRPVRDAAIGSVARRLAQLYFEATHGHLPAYRKWLLPVFSAARATNAPRPLVSVA